MRSRSLFAVTLACLACVLLAAPLLSQVETWGAYLPRAGGTLTGAVSGTTGTFATVNPTTSLQVNGILLCSATAPTISSGFGTSPSITASNGTCAFDINVGTGGIASSGVIGLSTATTGWNCAVWDLTTTTATVFVTKQTASSTTTCTVGNFNTTAAAAAWAASDRLRVIATAF